jgi:hypothetical protein
MPGEDFPDIKPGICLTAEATAEACGLNGAGDGKKLARSAWDV